MLEDREPVVAPKHPRTDKERRHSKCAATESLFRGRGKDSLGFWILKCRPIKSAARPISSANAIQMVSSIGQVSVP
jgi:hypothetical protein